ncbi:hypothetical protein NM208_g4440 [Fusarium decemcellulare]|uniref:Uncharacterized protein n=1 Tax=Fusarium decemcellulare TaxID=57161 RepID=A0ACC1SKN0_9HYPO|nr:hypothetical protein NM208_g4440 [Fusarium decemcellulare]
MDPGTIFGIVSLALQVIKLADSVIETFDRVQNAPRELRDFRQAVLRLQRHFDSLQADISPSADLLHEDDAFVIEETLTLCKDLLQQQVSRQNENKVTSVIRGVWSSRNSQKLVKYKARIDEHYTQILVPSWLRSLSAGTASSSRPPIEHDDQPLKTDWANTLSLVSPQPLQSISRNLDELKTAVNKEGVEQILRRIDYELRKWWNELGLLDEEDLDDLIPNPNEKLRRSSLNFERAPTTLYLERAPEKHRRLKLERLHIMARDDESRILQYQNHDATIHVTHIVPYGSIPWTPDKSSKKVSFLKDHLITVVDQEGYHLYRLDPKYKFHDRESCERFQSTLRERNLYGAFEPVEIKMNGRVVARRQLMRFWQRAGDHVPTNTITFYVSSSGHSGDHEEIDLSHFIPTIALPRPRRLSGLGRHTETVSIDLYPSYVGTKRLHIKFETSEGQRIS